MKDKKIIVITVLIVMVAPVTLIKLMYDIIINSVGTGTMVKSDYISIFNSLNTSLIGLMGNILTIVGAYYIFRKENEDKDGLKQYHVENITEILINSISDSWFIADNVCRTCINSGAYERAKNELSKEEKLCYKDKITILGILYYISVQYRYKKYESVRDKKDEYDLFVDLVLKHEIKVSEWYQDGFKLEDYILTYFTRKEIKSIRKWIEIKNKYEFKEFYDVYEFISCRDEIVNILKRMSEDSNLDFSLKLELEYNLYMKTMEDIENEHIKRNSRLEKVE